MAFCPSCGQPIPEGADRCARCEDPIASPARRRTPAMAAMVAALLAAVLVACMVAYLWGRSQRQAPVVMTGPLKLPVPQPDGSPALKADEIRLGNLDKPLTGGEHQLRLSTPDRASGGLRLSTPNPGAFEQPRGQPAGSASGGHEPLTLHSRKSLRDP